MSLLVELLVELLGEEDEKLDEELDVVFGNSELVVVFGICELVDGVIVMLKDVLVVELRVLLLDVLNVLEVGGKVDVVVKDVFGLVVVLKKTVVDVSSGS